MSLEIKNLQVKLNKKTILHNLQLEIEDGEYIALLGPSGSGKTTLLKNLSGLLETDQGQVLLDGKDYTDIPAYKRPIAVVFQDMRLFPHYTVFENIAFPLKFTSLSKQEVKDKILHLLKEVQLEGYADSAIQNLSGGQQQRVALARALAMDPKLLLLDEPFSGLDEPLRREMGQLVYRLHKEKGLTTLLITHDKREAIEFADRIAFLHQGHLVQVGSVKEMVDQPKDEYLASFFGKMNELNGRIEEGIFYSDQLDWVFKLNQTSLEGSVKLMVRPAKIKLFSHDLSEPEAIQCAARIEKISRFPDIVECLLRLEDDLYWTASMSHHEFEALSVESGSLVHIFIQPKNIKLFPK